jgi:hypothetical protein
MLLERTLLYGVLVRPMESSEIEKILHLHCGLKSRVRLRNGIEGLAEAIARRMKESAK